MEESDTTGESREELVARHKAEVKEMRGEIAVAIVLCVVGACDKVVT